MSLENKKLNTDSYKVSSKGYNCQMFYYDSNSSQKSSASRQSEIDQDLNNDQQQNNPLSNDAKNSCTKNEISNYESSKIPLSSLQNYQYNSESDQTSFQFDKTKSKKKSYQGGEVKLQSNNLDSSGSFGKAEYYYNLQQNFFSVLKTMKGKAHGDLFKNEINICNIISDKQANGSYKDLIEILDSNDKENDSLSIKLEYGYTDIKYLLNILTSCLINNELIQTNTFQSFELISDELKSSCMNYFKVANQQMNPDLFFKIQYEVAHQISLLSDLKILHRDIKLANMIMTADQKTRLIDFNLSKECKEDYELEKTMRWAGTLKWDNQWDYNENNNTYKTSPFKVDIYTGVYELEKRKDDFFSLLKKQSNTNSLLQRIEASENVFNEFQRQLKDCQTSEELKQLLKKFKQEYENHVDSVNSQLEQLKPLFYSERIDFDSLRELMYVHGIPKEACQFAKSHGNILKKSQTEVTPRRILFKLIELVAVQREKKVVECLSLLIEIMGLFKRIKSLDLSTDEPKDAYNSQIDFCLIAETISRFFGSNKLALEFAEKAQDIFKNNFKSIMIISVIRYGNCAKELSDLNNLMGENDKALKYAKEALSDIKLYTNSQNLNSTNNNQRTENLELYQLIEANLYNQICESYLYKYYSLKEKQNRTDEDKSKMKEFLKQARENINKKKEITDRMGKGSTLTAWTHFHEGRINELEGKKRDSLDCYNKTMEIANDVYHNQHWYWYLFLQTRIAQLKMGEKINEKDENYLHQIINNFKSLKIDQKEDNLINKIFSHLGIYNIEFPDLDGVKQEVKIPFSLILVKEFLKAIFELLELDSFNFDQKSESLEALKHSLPEQRIDEKMEEVSQQLRQFFKPILEFEFKEEQKNLAINKTNECSRSKLSTVPFLKENISFSQILYYYRQLINNMRRFIIYIYNKVVLHSFHK